jgi:hypothetical protein
MSWAPGMMGGMNARLARKTARALALTICLAAVSGSGCGREKKAGEPPIGVAWELAPDPPAMGESTFFFTLTDSTTGSPVAGATVRLEGNMNHAGMKPVFSTAREIAPGQYEAPIEFTMGGDWFVSLEATLADGRVLHRQVDVPGVRAR